MKLLWLHSTGRCLIESHKKRHCRQINTKRREEKRLRLQPIELIIRYND